MIIKRFVQEVHRRRDTCVYNFHPASSTPKMHASIIFSGLVILSRVRANAVRLICHPKLAIDVVDHSLELFRWSVLKYRRECKLGLDNKPTPGEDFDRGEGGVKVKTTQVFL